MTHFTFIVQDGHKTVNVNWRTAQGKRIWNLSIRRGVWHPFPRAFCFTPDHRKACLRLLPDGENLSGHEHPAASLRERSCPPTLVTGRCAYVLGKGAIRPDPSWDFQMRLPWRTAQVFCPPRRKMWYAGDSMKGPSKDAETGWIDISVPLRTGMAVYPGDAPVLVERTFDVARGDPVTLSRVSMGLHAGTHVDAPLHFFGKGLTIDRLPLAALIGTAQVIDIRDGESIARPEVEGRLIEERGIVLFKTRNSALWRQAGFCASYVSLSAEAAEYLAKRGVSAVGIDYLSIDGFGHGEAGAHRVLLGAGVAVIEGLDLSEVGEGLYECICLPLRVEGGEAAPARVVIRPLR